MNGLVMNGLKLLTLVPVMTLGLVMPVWAASPHQMVIQSAIEDFIRPGFHHFADEAAALKEHVGALCETPSAEALETSRSQFTAVVTAFSRVEFVRIGPLGVGDRLERLLFWPDRKGIALKQVQQALAEKDASAGAAATLQGKSVAMQGLGALEFLLFGTDADQLASAVGGYRCSYAGAITSLVGGLAHTMDAEWADAAGVSDSLLMPKADAADYRTDQEVLEKLAATLVHGTETIRDQRLMPVLGASGGKPKPKSALFWRSGMTVPALAANFAGLGDFFTAAKFPEAIGANNSWITNGTEFEFANAARAAKAVVDPIDKAVGDERQLKALNYMVIITGSLDTLVGENLAAALGLSVGFSALDGD